MRTQVLVVLQFLVFNIFSSGLVLEGRAMPPLDMSTAPAAPDYAVQGAWLARPENPTAPVDVFYVYPTVLFDDVNWMLDPADAGMRTAAKYCLDTQAVVFEGMANIYAPMYRQMNIAGLGLSDVEAVPLQDVVHSDVFRALKYYLEYENDGRPFFLAGHSQGSMILTNLMLEHWGALGVEDRLIAALLIGWSVTEEDLVTNPSVKMCDSSDRTRCVISYNSVAEGRQDFAPTLKKGALAVNPLSWTMDGKLVVADQNLGAVFFDKKAVPTRYEKFTSAQIAGGGVVVQPGDTSLVTVSGGHFPAGVYHAFDYSLFFENIKANIKERIEAY